MGLLSSVAPFVCFGQNTITGEITAVIIIIVIKTLIVIIIVIITIFIIMI